MNLHEPPFNLFETEIPERRANLKTPVQPEFHVTTIQQPSWFYIDQTICNEYTCHSIMITLLSRYTIPGTSTLQKHSVPFI